MVSSVASDLTTEDRAFLSTLEDQLGIVADLSRADALIYTRAQKGKAHVRTHVHPHSVAPVYLEDYTRQQINLEQAPIVAKTLLTHRRQQGNQEGFGNGVRVQTEVLPVFSPVDPRRLIAAVSLDSSLIEYERHRRRSRVFRKTLNRIQQMLTEGWLHHAETLSFFGEQEGLVVVDKKGVIRYTSGIAANLYRKIGYVQNLVGSHIESLETHDDALVRQALMSHRCLEEESEDGGRYWIRKVLPVVMRPGLTDRLRRHFHSSPSSEVISMGTLLVLRDITDERRKEQEIRVKNAMIQEIHHRVKNNLQTIAALLRIQSRRFDDDVALAAFNDATNRILSIAVIHEFLSEQGSFAINIKEVGNRIITQLRQSIVNPGLHIQFELQGPSIWLPPRQATACALVTNELLQNAVEHGFKCQESGNVSMILTDEGDQVIISVTDNGCGLPDDFDLHNTGSLGLQITRTLVTEDLQGSIELFNNEEQGTTARLVFSKQLFGGEEGWNANVS